MVILFFINAFDFFLIRVFFLELNASIKVNRISYSEYHLSKPVGSPNNYFSDSFTYSLLQQSHSDM